MKSQSFPLNTNSHSSKDLLLRERQHVSDDLTQCVGVSCLLQQTIEDHSKATKELHEFLHSKLRWINKQWKNMKSVDFVRSSRNPIMEPKNIQEMSECIVICCNLMDSLAAVKQSEHTNLTGKILGTLNQHVLNICRTVQSFPAESQITKQDQTSLEKLKVLRQLNEKNIEEEEDEEDTRKRKRSSSQTHKNEKQQGHGKKNDNNNNYIVINNLSVIEDQNDNKNQQKINKEDSQHTSCDQLINQNAFSNELRSISRQDQFVGKNHTEKLQELQLEFNPKDVVVAFFPRDGSNSPSNNSKRLMLHEINKNQEKEIQKNNQKRQRDNKSKSQLLGDGQVLRQGEASNSNKMSGCYNGQLDVVEIDDEEEELGNGQAMEIEEKEITQQSDKDDGYAEDVLMISSIEGNQQKLQKQRITSESQIPQKIQKKQFNNLDVPEDKQHSDKSPNIWNQQNKDNNGSQVSSASTSSHQFNHEMDNAICISDSSDEDIKSQQNVGENKKKSNKEEKEENIESRDVQKDEFKLQDYFSTSQQKEEEEECLVSSERDGNRKRSFRKGDDSQKQKSNSGVNVKLNSCNVSEIKEKSNSISSSLNHGIVRSMEALKINDIEVVQTEELIGISAEEEDNQGVQILGCNSNKLPLCTTGKPMKIIRKLTAVEAETVATGKHTAAVPETNFSSAKHISNQQQPQLLGENMVIEKNDSLEDDQEHDVSYYVYKDNQLIRRIRKQNNENNSHKAPSRHHNGSSNIVSTGSKKKIVKAQQIQKNQNI